MKRHGFRIELTADGVLSHDEAVRALRSFLKAAWRSYGLKCTSAEPIEHGGREPSEDAPQSTPMAESDK